MYSILPLHFSSHLLYRQIFFWFIASTIMNSNNINSPNLNNITLLLPKEILIDIFLYLRYFFQSFTTQHHAAPRSTTQHHAAPRSTTQHHAAPRSITQHHAESPCITLHHPASPCITLHHTVLPQHHHIISHLTISY